MLMTKSIGGRQSAISFHEGQSWASFALDGQIRSAHMGHTHIRILYASFCFPLDVLDIWAPLGVQQSRGLFYHHSMLNNVSFLLFVNKWLNIHLVMFALLQEQKFVLGVILMVPCYAIESVISLKQLLALCWLVIAHLIAYLLIFGTSLQQYVSLVNPDTSVYCGILRDGYEAFAMYCFGRYITACLGEFFSWASETF